MITEDLKKQIRFIEEADRLKGILRQTVVMDKSRQENSAEHSWHVCLMALVLARYSVEKVDISRVIKILVLHDFVEIEAGDTFSYDPNGLSDQTDREKAAADKLFGLLPAEQAEELRELWEDYEDGASAEARFARALDRFHPLIHNYRTHGASWQKHGVTKDQVIKRNKVWSEAAPALWEYAEMMINESVKNGWLKE